MKKPKVIIIGLDGGSWNLIKELMRKGKLVTFRKIIEKGTHSILETVIPPVTGPAWVSFATGKNPGKHGVFDFVKLKDNYLKPITSKDIKVLTFYDILSLMGFQNIIISLPLSYPPKNIFRGIMVSDFLYPRYEITPRSKSEYLKKYEIHKVSLHWIRTRLLYNIIESALYRINMATKLLLSEKWDLFFLWYGESDMCLHYFWNDILNNNKIGQKATLIFELIDSFINIVLKLMKNHNNYFLFIVSDHGFKEYSYKVNLNKLFTKSGSLLLRDLKVLTTSRNRATLLSKITSILFKKIMLNSVAYFFLKSMRGYVPKVDLLLDIDFQKSKFYVPTNEAMGVCVNEFDPLVKEKLISNIIKLLKKIKYNNINIFKSILRKEEIFKGPYVNDAPDIILISEDFLVTAQPFGMFVEKFNRGYHDIHGIFIAYGENIREGYYAEKGIKIYDIAPTVLYIFNVPIPNDMDGRVLAEIFKIRSEIRKREPKYVDSSYYTYLIWRKSLKRKLLNIRRKF